MGRASLWLGRKSEMGDEMRSRKLFLHECCMSCIAKQGRITRAMLRKCSFSAVWSQWEWVFQCKEAFLIIILQYKKRKHTTTLVRRTEILYYITGFIGLTHSKWVSVTEKTISTSVYFSSTDAYRQITHTQQKKSHNLFKMWQQTSQKILLSRIFLTREHNYVHVRK